MIRYIARRLVSSVVVILALVAVVFFMLHLVGDPARLMLPQEATVEQYEALRQQLGLDRPLHVQFGTYLSGLLVGDFGTSLWQGVPALSLVLDRLPNTLYLTLVTMAIALPTAVGLGVVAALRPGSPVDRLITVFSLGGISIANFWLGLMLILLFAVELRWLPTSGFGGLSFVIMPAIALALRPIGRIGQLTRATVLDEMSKLYVNTARSKGLPERAVIVRHTLRNASLPVITLAGDELAGLLNGAVVIETLFAWPGLGSLMIQAIEHRDLPIVEASLFVVAVTVVLLNLLVDLSYSVLDPRVRYA
ncbi:MAG: ABC transporter permease [Chloroflexi bacterium]|nr:ABC transporter permease [Chloroflexota bacterium]